MAEKKEKQYVSDNARLMAEWGWEKNDKLGFFPTQMTHQSNKKVWWKCSQGHEWQAAINNRTQGRNCPYCSGKKVLKGYNDLQTVNPTIAKEWNGDLKPEDFTSKSNKKVWWKCIKGHEWQTTIAHRDEGTGCPTCKSERHTSFPEFAAAYYLKKYGLNIIHSYKDLGYELDVYIPSIKTAIEYDGYYWHKNKTEQDLEKNLRCQQDGITLYRLREGLQSLNDSSIDYIVQRNQEDLAIVLEQVLKLIIGPMVDVNLERDTILIENSREYTEKEASLLSINPEIASEWNYEKNGKLLPQNLFASSNKRVWWKCKLGHEWQATINHRNSGTDCPYCSGKKVLSGYNDLLTTNPTLATEWNYEKNHSLRPESVTANSNKKVWWKCSQGHEWEADIAHRSIGHGCPYCAGRKILKGNNDLTTINPDLAAEWNYQKNGILMPENFTANSGKKVWWKCHKGHEWQTTIDSRNKGTGCPFCAGKKVLCGYNDLKTTNPSVANEWNYNRNDILRPEDVTANSHKKVWWKCSQGHEWETAIYNRNNCGCPICANERRGMNYSQTMLLKNGSLAEVRPDVAAQWHPTKNNNLLPNMVTCSTHKSIWWQCSQGHEWEATVASRTSGQGCPVCSGKRTVAGINDLATQLPELAKQWHPTKNNELVASDVSKGSDKKVWWLCDVCGHEWVAVIGSRSKGAGCPVCAKEKRKKNK